MLPSNSAARTIPPIRVEEPKEVPSGPNSSPMPPPRFIETVTPYHLVPARSHYTLDIAPGQEYFIVDFVTAAQNGLITTPTVFAYNDEDQVRPTGVITNINPSLHCQRLLNDTENILTFSNPPPPSPVGFKPAKVWTPLVQRRFGEDALKTLKEDVDVGEKALRKKEWKIDANTEDLLGAALTLQKISSIPIPSFTKILRYLHRANLPRILVARAAIILGNIRSTSFVYVADYLFATAGATPEAYPLAALAVAAERSNEGHEDAYWLFSIGGDSDLFVSEDPRPLPVGTDIDLALLTYTHLHHAQLAAFAMAKNVLTIEINRRAEICLQVDSQEVAEQMADYIDAIGSEIKMERQQHAGMAAEGGLEGHMPEAMDGPGPTA